MLRQYFGVGDWYVMDWYENNIVDDCGYTRIISTSILSISLLESLGQSAIALFFHWGIVIATESGTMSIEEIPSFARAGNNFT